MSNNFETDQHTHGPAKALEDGYTTDNESSHEDTEWLRLAKEAYRASDDWFDIAVRRLVERDLHLFNSVHPAGSRYNDASYDKRSKIFRPNRS